MVSYVIIGASRGLGYQFLKTLSANPSNKIVGLARNKPAVQAKADSDNLSNVHIVQADLIDSTSLNAAAEETATHIGGAVDYLIVNGAYISETTQALKPTDWIGKEKWFQNEMTTSINTNVIGVLYAVNAFLPLVRNGNVKKIVVISTGMADTEITRITGLSEALPYSISKAAVNMLVAKYAAELKDEGIALLALSPGVVDTKGLDYEDDKCVKATIKAFIQRFQKYDPTFTGPMTPAKSVDMQLKVIDELTLEQSGDFLSHNGNKEWL